MSFRSARPSRTSWNPSKKYRNYPLHRGRQSKCMATFFLCHSAAAHFGSAKRAYSLSIPSIGSSIAFRSAYPRRYSTASASTIWPAHSPYSVCSIWLQRFLWYVKMSTFTTTQLRKCRKNVGQWGQLFGDECDMSVDLSFGQNVSHVNCWAYSVGGGRLFFAGYLHNFGRNKNALKAA